MKLFTKIFLCTIIVITAALSVSGYLLISASFENAIERENQRGLEEYQLLKFTLQAGILSARETGQFSKEQLVSLARQTADIAPEGNKTAIFEQNRQPVYSNFPVGYTTAWIQDVEIGELKYVIEYMTGAYYLIVSGGFEQSGQSVYLSTARDISAVIQEKQEMQERYVTIFIIVLCASATIMLGLSMLLTKPIKKLTRATKCIADGNYAQRVQVNTHDELGTLGESFNSMALTIEQTIRELERNAQQKEDFVANFAHELKTPLTSVIGYADMIYQKELDRQQIKEAASYILNEGMRLESLSLKLMDLIVLDKQEFLLTQMRADELFRDVTSTIRPLIQAKDIGFCVYAEKAYIRVEYDLFKTLVLNLIDNAIKAGSSTITFSGKTNGTQYVIEVVDNGCGIPKEELSRITEAFYMVDKSRSRRQHGAGLGLAIASHIAMIHGSALYYESEVGTGTTVRLILPLEEVQCDAPQ